MKIIGFSQLRNELSNRNLENWFRSMNNICDYIYIYDQNSTDGSKEYYKTQKNCIVIYSDTNNFRNELYCKDILLKKLLTDHSDCDAIFWMDGDTIAERKCNKDCICDIVKRLDKKYDHGVTFRHYNLWRSDIFYRIDNNYHNLNNSVIPLWLNSSNKLSFYTEDGLHKKQFPPQIKQIVRSDISLIHRGFCTDIQLINRYNNYKKFGMRGDALNRILDENTLEVKEFDVNLYPEWFDIKDTTNPKNKIKLIDIYKGQIHE